jgi:hypothetical protein
MAKQKISNTDLLWIFHEKLSEYGDHRISLAIIRGDKGEWQVATQRRLPKREPDLATRIGAIEKQLRKQYVLAAD